jgi:FkbM family methyltransferase
MKRKFLIVRLTLLKWILGKRNIITKIAYGHNAGLLWCFNKKSNNEFILGDWEMPMQEIFLQYIKPGNTIYDLGAHQGFLALLASRLVGTEGKVYSFEPLPSNYALLKKNMQINQIKNCATFYGAVTATPGFINFTISQADVSNTYVQSSPAFNANAQHIEVPAFSLDNLVATRLINAPDFLKIDVEGAELDVLKGATNLLKELAPIIYLETHNIHNPGVDTACLDYLNSIGYSIKEKYSTYNDTLMGAYILHKQ